MKSKLNITYILVLICIFCDSCRTKTDKSYLNNWKSYPITYNIDSLSNYNHSINDWGVYLKNDTVRVIDINRYVAPLIPIKLKNNPLWHRGKRSFLQVNDGYLIGAYKGEWGGDLYWFSSDGSKNYKISDDEIVQFIKRGNKIYAIQGLAHGGYSEGSILNIFKEDNKWIAKEILKLPAAPSAIAIDGQHDFIVMTYSNLLKVDEHFNTTLLADRGMQYDELYPNNLIIKDDIIYAGMRGKVYKYNLLTKKQDWLQP